MPTTSQSNLPAARAAPLITAFIPGTKPAPTMMAMRFLFVFIILIGVWLLTKGVPVWRDERATPYRFR